MKDMMMRNGNARSCYKGMEETFLFSGDEKNSPTWEPSSSNYSAEKIFNSTSNMAGLPLSPVELEPLPSLFATPINTSYKFHKTSPQVTIGRDHRMSPMPYPNSYTHHQPQQLLSPNGYSSSYPLDQSNFVAPSSVSSTSGPNFGTPFPSMSVNVSMNMTMGYLPPDPTTLQHPHPHQMTSWATPPVPSPVNSLHNHPASSSPYVPSYSSPPVPSHHNFCHHQPYSATYSFAADFRPEATMEGLRSHHSWIPASSSTAASSLISSASALSSCSIALGSSSSSSTSSNARRHHKPARSTEVLSPSASGMGMGSKSNLCRICGKTYARPSTLKTHLRTHSGEKPYRCLECNKSFSQAANLTAHVRTHSGEKPFRCPICDRRFSQSSSVTTHMRTHSGERPYRCRLCKKAFSDSSTLTKHLRIHSGEKPYQCKLCLLRFSQSGNLNRHMRVHSSST